MTTEVRYPSSQFPPEPTVALTLPLGWEPLVLEGAVLAAGKVVPGGQFRPNIVATISRKASGFDLGPTVATTEDIYSALQDSRSMASAPSLVSEYEAHNVEYAFTDGQAGALVQAIVFVVVPNGSVIDLIQLTGSCAVGDVEGTFAEIRAALAGAAVGTYPALDDLSA